jgi:hypothetical protein
MSDLSVNRTLVKSPPELWNEVSETQTLAQHLGEFGEISISRLDPEHTVAWEGEHARGTVELEESGWGTKVTLSADLAVVEAEPEPEPEPVRVPWYRRWFSRPEPDPEPQAVVEPETVVDPVHAAAVLEDTLDHLGAAHHRPFSREG